MVNGVRTATDDASQERAEDVSYVAFSAFPAELAGLLEPFLDDVTNDVVAAIRTEIPEYARPRDDTYMHVVRKGVEGALQDFLARMGKPDKDWAPVKATYERIGRGEAEEGRSLDTFQAALRVGARVTWRRINTLVEAGLLPRQVLSAFGEAIFVHLDEMAAATAAGHTEARLYAAGELQRRRHRLIDLLTTEPPVSPEAIGDLARSAQWPVPRELAVVAVDTAGPAAGHTAGPVTGPAAGPGTGPGTGPGAGPGAGPGGTRPIVPPEFLARFDTRPGVIVVPDPQGPGRARAIAAVLHGMRAAVGPTVAPAESARSLRWATEALELARRGVLAGPGPLHCADHLATLLLFHDDALIDALARRHLLPLDAVRSPQRERLAETLLCWLRCGHNASEVATRLAVHPQTVRYRLRQLDEVFGERLHDPAAQFEMQLVLHALSLRAGRA
ncbi:PucR family transcriptional regulator [Streptomyces sp. NPDC059009]|uniref:PucR family transcriptional regulator n=1 Tax=Streptomyces sp. NPDC059009 TaxID=3346694 RepID=UPI0036C382C8